MIKFCLGRAEMCVLAVDLLSELGTEASLYSSLHSKQNELFDQFDAQVLFRTAHASSNSSTAPHSSELSFPSSHSAPNSTSNTQSLIQSSSSLNTKATANRTYNSWLTSRDQSRERCVLLHYAPALCWNWTRNRSCSFIRSRLRFFLDD